MAAIILLLIILLLICLVLLGAAPLLRDVRNLGAGAPQPGAVQTIPAQPVPSQSSDPKGNIVVTNYTTFHHVAFRHGSVVTGWAFAESTDIKPQREFCYFDIPGSSPGYWRHYNIEIRPTPGAIAYPGGTDIGLTPAEWTEAASKCQWHPGNRPASRTTLDDEARGPDAVPQRQTLPRNRT
jgi:hypothetical protein